MVETIVGFCAELEIDRPLKPDIFEGAEIPALIARSKDACGLGISRTVLSAWNLCEGGRIEPLLDGVGRVGVWVLNIIRAPSRRSNKKTYAAGINVRGGLRRS